MITLIGHGYVGKHIKKELEHQNIHHNWIGHTQSVPAGTTAIINAAGYTGRQMLMPANSINKKPSTVM